VVGFVVGFGVIGVTGVVGRVGYWGLEREANG